MTVRCIFLWNNLIIISMCISWVLFSLRVSDIELTCGSCHGTREHTDLDQFWIYHKHYSPPLQWRHNGRESVLNHQPHDCLLNCLFSRRSNKTSKLRVTGLCEGNSPVTGEFPAQRASNAENVSIWWRHHEKSQQMPHNSTMTAIHGMRFVSSKSYQV